MLRRLPLLLFVATMTALIVGLPILVYRFVYTTNKRLRAIEPGQVYRSGQMTAEGFANAIRAYGIRTVLNLQDDNPNPNLPRTFFDRRSIRESEVCEQLGVDYRLIGVGLLYPRTIDAPRDGKYARPPAVDEFLKLMDDPSAYPILFHCKAGLHRTGILAAIYRMEYQGWTHQQAYEELRANGFGDRACTAANEYVRQYVLHYQPRKRMMNEER